MFILVKQKHDGDNFFSNESYECHIQKLTVLVVEKRICPLDEDSGGATKHASKREPEFPSFFISSIFLLLLLLAQSAESMPQVSWNPQWSGTSALSFSFLLFASLLHTFHPNSAYQQQLKNS